MSAAEQPARPERGLLPSEKIITLRNTLEFNQIPYAFGGAIALFYYRDPRSTIDIDINIFLPPEQHTDVENVLVNIYPIDTEKAGKDIIASGQTRSNWDTTKIDLFFADTEFHTEMSRRVQRKPFLDTEINILSAEDLMVCKMLFDRPKDWVDIQAVVLANPGQLDRAYMESALEIFVEPSDGRFERWQQIVDKE